jgi:CRP-like cAMP-binding protein
VSDVQPDPALIDRLRALPLFAALSEDELRRLGGWVQVEEYDSGDRLPHEGAAGYAFFVIDEGNAHAAHGDTVIGRLGPGDFFGEAAIIGDGRRNADVVADGPLWVYAMFGTHFLQLQEQMPQVAVRIESAVRDRAGNKT